MVEHPGGEADRGILDPVQRLRTVRHLLGVTKAVLVEKVELIPRMLLVGREAGRGRFAELESLRNVGWDGGRHVGVDTDQFGRRLQSHLLRHRIPPIAALRHISRVSEALHQHGPGACDADGVPAGRGRLARKAVSRQRRDHQMERVRCARAMCRWIGQWIDNLQLLDDRPGPSMGDDERQRVFMFRTNVNEMNVDPVDLGDEVRQGFQLRLALAPIVLCRPIPREFLNRRQLHALGLIGDSLLGGPTCRLHAPAEVNEIHLRNVDVEGPDGVAVDGGGQMRGKQAEGTCGGRRGKQAASGGR